MEEKYSPEVYTEDELDALEAHIETHFGPMKNVFHELVSPDIHVDIAIVEPREGRNYYTLVTMGMGAHCMNTPPELDSHKLQRAELLINLPADWDIHGKEEEWYWPLRWLKVMARLPGQHNTWLGWGHTVPKGEPFAENTKLCGMLLLDPAAFGEEAAKCTLPNGEVVNFYQMIPLYEEEMTFKVNNKGAGPLLERMNDDMLEVVDIHRENVCAFMSRKNWAIPADGMKQLLQWDGPEGCIATDRILVDGCKVGYMYRDEPSTNMPDSGWCFTAGDESQEYMDNPDNSGIYALNTICNYDPDIIPLLGAPVGTAFIRDENGVFQQEEYVPLEEE